MDFKNKIINGDCIEELKKIDSCCISACITDPPYNYEFIGHKWDTEETNRRISRVKDSKTLVKNIPYGSGLSGGVRNKRWYDKIRKNILDYEDWTNSWAEEVFRVCKPGAYVAVFNSTRTVAHVQVALEKAGFYARDILVYRRSSGIPKGLNMAKKLEKMGHKDAESWTGWHSALRSEWEGIVLVQKPLKDNYFKTVMEYGVGLMRTQDESEGFASNIIEGIKRDRGDSPIPHCTVKPYDLMERLIKLLVPLSEENIVLDPFAGSGTTLLAAKKNGLSYLGMEIDPSYCEVIANRLNGFTYQNAKCDANPQSTSKTKTDQSLFGFR